MGAGVAAQSGRIHGRLLSKGLITVDALRRLGSMPGMADVKAQVEQIIQFSRVSTMRKKQGLKSQPQTNHMVFTGNPGTGKTTAARLIGEAFARMGLLCRNPRSSDDGIPFIEIHHADVIHPHVGQAERTIKEKFKQARGGVIFIDEAYAFVDGESNHKQDDKVVAAVVQLMEDMRDEIMVIAAGYPEDMESFLNSNPGLRSRFPNRVHFPDYSVPDLIQVAKQMLDDQEFTAASDYTEALASVLWIEKAKPNFGNARTVRNHVERSIRKQAVRVSQITNPTRADLSTLQGCDLVHDARAVRETEKEVLARVIKEAQTRLMVLDFMEISQRSRE
jgi:stage V sporulation protein K